MKKHDKEMGKVIVLNGAQRVEDIKKVLDSYDATVHVGISTVIYRAAIVQYDEDGEETIEIPRQDELRASVAVARCLMPIRLRGSELKAIRKILGKTLEEMAKSLDERTAMETVSRWESETQPMGGYAEKLFRLFVCEELKDHAPGIEYNGKMIADLRVLDPWRVDAEFQVPPVHLSLIELKERSGTIIEAWNERKAA